MRYSPDNLLVRPLLRQEDSGLVLEITPEKAGWDYIAFQVRRLSPGQSWSSKTDENELALVSLSGKFQVDSDRGQWSSIGGRPNVFEGAAHVLYLPRRTHFKVLAEDSIEFAAASAPTDQDHAPFLIQPGQVSRYIRGGDSASRQINDLLPPGSAVHRLVLVEVYTPGGNWSSYPPHKHDRHQVDGQGQIREADLEEVYFYKIDHPHGYAFQWIYTDANSPLHQAGYPIDAVVRAENNCAVLVPEGYHPVASPPGFTTYYLNVLAGSAQTLANQDDPRFSWIKENYQQQDPRLPLYP